MAKDQSWEITHAKVADFLASEKLACFPDSPFHKLASGGKWKGRKLSKAKAEQLKVVARPRYLLGLLLSPPFGRGGLWFYGQDKGLVGCHNLGDKGQFALVELSFAQVLEHAYACLELDWPTPSVDVEYSLSSSALLTLVGLVDANRELGFHSLLQREPHPQHERRFSAGMVLRALAVAQKSQDERWLSALIEHFSPFPFDLDADQAEEGFLELEKLGLLESDGEEWGFTRDLQLLAPKLATPVGYASLYGRSTSHSGQKSLSGFRTTSGLWSLEVRGDRLILGSRTEQELTALFADAQGRWCDEWKSLPADGARCSCGRDLPSDARFCPGCGKAVEQGCRKCGAELREDAAFCTKCGAAV